MVETIKKSYKVVDVEYLPAVAEDIAMGKMDQHLASAVRRCFEAAGPMDLVNAIREMRTGDLKMVELRKVMDDYDESRLMCRVILRKWLNLGQYKIYLIPPVDTVDTGDLADAVSWLYNHLNEQLPHIRKKALVYTHTYDEALQGALIRDALVERGFYTTGTSYKCFPLEKACR